MLIQPLDVEALRESVARAEPFPFFAKDDFLEEERAHEIAAAFPSFEQAERMGRRFTAVNERNKIQVTDADLFPPAIHQLHDALADQHFLDLLGEIMGIPGLIADPMLGGGGLHQTGPRGHLDVHVDFNYLKERQLHRRLNILIYLNPEWRESWGGRLELWDRDVRKCVHSFVPRFNRCVVFATSDISYHGVTAVTCPPDVTRKSFAAYYYTREAPPGWEGRQHSTIFRARPDEHFKRLVAMPAERGARRLRQGWEGIKASIRNVRDRT
jgi:hypothetical protein